MTFPEAKRRGRPGVPGTASGSFSGTRDYGNSVALAAFWG
jgi:hypothetical protein